jgi:toxin YoeB
MKVAINHIAFDRDAWNDYIHLQKHDPKLCDRLNTLIQECLRTPFAGTGKPEPLRGQLAGWWSRRFTQEHRLVYRVEGDALFIAQCRYHY